MKIQKLFKIFLIFLGSSFFLVSIYTIWRFNKNLEKIFQEINWEILVEHKSEFTNKTQEFLRENFVDEKKILYKKISPDKSFEAIVIETSPVLMEFSSNRSDAEKWGGRPLLIVGEALMFINLTTQERKIFSLEELIPERIFSFMKNEAGPSQYSVYLSPPLWGKGSKNCWLILSFRSSADPSFPIDIYLIKILVEDWKIENFKLFSSGDGSYGIVEIQLNPEKEEVLYSFIDKEALSLFLYNLKSQARKKIVSYPFEIVYKYFKNPLDYRFSLEKESRWLHPKWIDENTISYLDFETRKEIKVKINTIKTQ